jgi:opacity protein-like surface antigen
VDGDYTFGASGSGTQSQHLDVPPTALQNGNNYDVARAIKISAGGSVRGRVGYLLDFLKGDLIYFTGGLGFASGTVTGTEAFAADPTDVLVPQPCPGPNCSPAILASPFSINLTESHTHTGLVFGVGWQHRVGRLLIIGAEYRHGSLGANYSVGASDITEKCSVDGPSNFITANSGCTAAQQKGDTSTPTIGERKLSIKSNSVLFTLQVRLDKLLGR